jgi:hypothetical protein
VCRFRYAKTVGFTAQKPESNFARMKLPPARMRRPLAKTIVAPNTKIPLAATHQALGLSDLICGHEIAGGWAREPLFAGEIANEYTSLLEVTKLYLFY